MRPPSAAERHVRSSCFLLLLFLTWLAMTSAFPIPLNLMKRSGERLPWGPHRQIQASATTHRRLTSSLNTRILAENASVWNTLDGSPPLVIARGGSSGLFPDQTSAAYLFAATFSLPSSAMYCDLQLTKDGYGICRTGIDLGVSTTINYTFPGLISNYNVNGVLTEGFFSIDLTALQVLNNISATQPYLARSPSFDGLFDILQPTDLVDLASLASNTTLFWINVEFPTFFAQHKLDMSSYILSLMVDMPVDFISSPEITFLKAVKTGAPKNTPNLVLKFGAADDVEPSTNLTYGAILKDLKTIASYASGILVPKDYIWPVDNTGYLGAETKLVKDAHTAGLAVYASSFVNDPATPIYNYSFDPVREYLQYVPINGTDVDGFLTDFPTTASEALACFRGATPLVRKEGTKPFIISHNGDSGNYPGCTLLSYQSAVSGGASHIDCPIQMTQDGVPICRESPNLAPNTDVSTHSNLSSRISLIPQLQDAKGIFSINLTWAEIKTLKALMYSPGGDIDRNPAYTQESIITLSEFLSYAKNTSAGILIDIQNGYFLEMEVGLDVVGEVLRSLNASGLSVSDRVVIQSEDSSVLRRFQQLANYTLVFKVTDTNVLVTKTEVSDVKALANYVTLPRGLVQVANSGYLLNKTDIVDLFHAQNVSVFVSFLRNEFVTIPFDYEADPTLEIDTLIRSYQVDGLVTDFPATASNYLSNSCSNLKTQATTGLQYEIHEVKPGDLVTNLRPRIPAAPPAPTIRLNVSDGELALPPTFSPRPSPTAETPARTPSSSPSAAPRWLKPNIFLLSTAFVTSVIYHYHG
ncbi:hypothetical protein GOP47_0006129 [Adiantum capillus-veneris]|uniref:glycerophosphodiester phosphodiesterase n=1 Tax=Adiantum capillus-veneris TaxID=13818 RepID=A0A9D4ZK12_ADICA|nr:hypothetical protein GOP47_0006129 [Adiantum capillus-veneris]